jgi:aerobic-type carbon monoxide dehydrogenase small subunit (CoxS/CutS family)
MSSFALNGKPVEVDVDPATPLLWVLRDSLGLTGTKFGCGMALCGACTVHLDGKAIRSCVAPVSRVEGKHVTTIEGLSPDSSHPLQGAWMEIDVPQCGYCQSGQIMSAAVLLRDIPKPTDKDIDEGWAATFAAVAPTLAFAANPPRSGNGHRKEQIMSRAENLLSKPDSLSQEVVVKVATGMGRRSFRRLRLLA